MKLSCTTATEKDGFMSLITYGYIFIQVLNTVFVAMNMLKIHKQLGTVQKCYHYEILITCKSVYVCVMTLKIWICKSKLHISFLLIVININK